MPRKSIYRQPGARTYQLVHRSQRDPLINDPDVPQHVLKEFERENVRKGKSRVDLENSLAPEEVEKAKTAGQSALYGIYYDDTEYDYTQHLRSVGLQEKGVDSIFIEASTSSKSKQYKGKNFNLIPKEALPSVEEITRERMVEAQEAIPSELRGFQPEMDPHLRQTIDALEDEAFIQDDANDDFFAELMEGGERGSEDEDGFEFNEDGIENGYASHPSKEPIDSASEDEDQDWHIRFAKFKQEQKAKPIDGSVLDSVSEGGDTLGRLPGLSVLGAKKRRRKGSSDASGYSMSSSSMFRNEGLTRLDEQFERLEKEYASDGSLDDDQLENASNISDESQPPLLNTREDFEAVMDEFLQYELVGNKLAPVLEGDTPTGKLETIRNALVAGDDDLRRQALLERVYIDDTRVPVPVDVDEEKGRWDCETILTTYSNLENHPRLLRLKQKTMTKKITLDKKTGLPSIIENVKLFVQQDSQPSYLEESSVDEDDQGSQSRVTVSRPKGETREDKKTRKKAVKEERHQRRIEKKGNKGSFALERKAQGKVLATREKAGVRKL